MAFQIFKTLFWWFPHLKLFVMPKSSQFNQDVRFSLMLFFSLVAIVVWLKIEMVLGAFLAGLVVSTFFPHKSELIHKLNDVGFGFLCLCFHPCRLYFRLKISVFKPAFDSPRDIDCYSDVKFALNHFNLIVAQIL